MMSCATSSAIVTSWLVTGSKVYEASAELQGKDVESRIYFEV